MGGKMTEQKSIVIIGGLACGPKAVAITPAELQDKLERDEDFILLDVRAPEEWQKNHIEARQTVQIPLPQLRQGLDKLPKDAEIVILCRISIRAY